MERYDDERHDRLDFALPPVADEAPTAPAAPPASAGRRREAPRAPVVVSEEGDALIDTEEIEREIEESMREVELETQRIARNVRFTLPERQYSATVGAGGANVRSARSTEASRCSSPGPGTPTRNPSSPAAGRSS